MPYELIDSNDIRFALPPSMWPTQLHAGGAPNVRIVRGYGSEDWFTVLDGVREPDPITITGVLQTDRDNAAIQTLLNNLEAAVLGAARLAQTDDAGNIIAFLPLLNGLPLEVNTDGIDGSFLTVVARVVPAAQEWTVVP